VRSFQSPVIASEGTLLHSIWRSLPDAPLSEPELYSKLRGSPRVAAGNLEGLVSRLVSSGGLVRLPGNNFRRSLLPPEQVAAAVETRSATHA